MEKIIVEHKQTCKRNMKVIVQDQALWREYLSLSEAAHQKEMRDIPPIKWRPLYVPIGDFRIAYGEKKSQYRADIIPNTIVRDDLFIMKGQKVAVQIVDYIAFFESMDGPTGFNCLPFYTNLIIGEAGQ